MKEFESRYAVILFADIVGCSEISNEHSVEDYAKILYQFYLTAHSAYRSTPSLGLLGNDAIFRYAGDEVCLFLLLDKDTKSLMSKECDKRIFAALGFSLALKFYWHISEYNLLRIEDHLLPRDVGIGIHVGPIALQNDPPKLLGNDCKLSIEGFAINLAKRIEAASHESRGTRIFLSDENNEIIQHTEVCKNYLKIFGLETCEVEFKAKNISTYRKAWELRPVKKNK